MDWMKLMHEASVAGLEVRANGDRLVVRGPRSSEALAQQLLAHKAELLPLLTAPPADFLSEEPCPICGSRERWTWLDGRLLCRVCLVLNLAPLTLVREGWERPAAGQKEVA
jgi:hypothetical protein